MQYNQPYGVSDPNAAYINGNPSTGTMGSIPPAASIEFPQREIVNLIASAGRAAPDNSDLFQLAKAVQSQGLIARNDAGTANQYAVTLSPPPGAYFRYLTVIAWISATNTGASNLNVNAMGPQQILRSDGTALFPGDIIGNTLTCFMYDGTAFRLVWRGSVAGSPVYLTAPRSFYVNFGTGSDANDGAAAALAGGHGPFKTLQHASDVAGTYNLNGYNITINVADSLSYTSVTLPAAAGNGQINWIGNPGTPANCVISGVNKLAIAVNGVANTMTGFKVQTSGAPAGDNLAGILGQGNVQATFSNFEWGQCAGPQIFAYGGAYLRLGGPKRISGGSTNNAYGLGCFIDCTVGAKVDCIEVSPAQPLTLIGNPSYDSGFVLANTLASVNFIYSALTGTAVGKKFDAQYNAIISVGGGGANYLPGTIAGTQSTGGQYA